MEQLRQRLGGLDAQAASVRRELFEAGPIAALPGTYVQVEAAGHRACLPAALAVEVVPLVALAKVSGAKEHVAGAFSYRGKPMLALDLGLLVGVRRELPLEAHVLVLAAARPISLVVDRVLGLLEAPSVALQDGERPTDWRTSKLVEGFCRDGEALVPLLRMSALEEAAGAEP